DERGQGEERPGQQTKATRLARQQDLEGALSVFAAQHLREENEGDQSDEVVSSQQPLHQSDARGQGGYRGAQSRKQLTSVRARRSAGCAGEDHDGKQGADNDGGPDDAGDDATPPELVPLGV